MSVRQLILQSFDSDLRQHFNVTVIILNHRMLETAALKLLKLFGRTDVRNV